MSRTVKIIFTLSVLLNLVIIGVAGGFVARFWWGGEMYFAPMAMRTGMFVHILEEIPSSEERAALMEKFNRVQQQNRALGRTIREERRQIKRLAYQDPFDGDAYDTAIARLLAAKRDIENGYANLLRDVAVALPADEREDILHWLYRDRRKHGKGGNKD